MDKRGYVESVLKDKEIKSIVNTIVDLMGYTDFDKIKIAMDALHWKWFTSDGVPNIEEIKATAFDLLYNAIINLYKYDIQESSQATGGLSVTVYKDEEGNIDGQIVLEVS